MKRGANIIFGRTITLALCILMLTACHSSSSPPLSMIDVSLYRTESTRAQPELIDIISDTAKLDTVAHQISEAVPVAKIPGADKIDRLYVLQCSYDSAGKVAHTDSYMYAVAEDQSAYIKPFKLTSGYSVDLFDSEAKSALWHKIGTEGWKAVKPLL